VTLTWTSDVKGIAGSIQMTPRNVTQKTFYGQFGPYSAPNGGPSGTVSVTIVATDHLGLSSIPLTVSFPLAACIIIP